MDNNAKIALSLLDIPSPVPLRCDEMARSLRVTFPPPHQESDRLRDFTATLTKAFRALGVDVVPYDQALDPDTGKIERGMVVIEQGEGKEDELAVHRITSLYKNVVVGLYDEPCPVDDDAPAQKKLDTIVGTMAWNMIHIPIFVHDDTWSICTMTGSIIDRGYEQFLEDVEKVLVPKLFATVVPPDRSKLTYREGALDIARDGLQDCVDDFERSARIWEANGLMLAHTSLDDVPERNRFFTRIARTFLDERTGMSYGFMVRQLPTQIAPAVRFEDADNAVRERDWEANPVQSIAEQLYARVNAGGTTWVVEVPDVWVLSTRSGCKKTDIDPSRDLVRMGLERGQIVLETSEGVSARQAQPSYDTLAILAHAVGNAITASISRALGTNETYVQKLEEQGFSITHWHGYPPHREVPEGYVLHGRGNPPVSCSTPQSAVYALTGKLSAFSRVLEKDSDYRGDVHVEPFHGTNISGSMLLEEAARWVDEHCTAGAVSDREQEPAA